MAVLLALLACGPLAATAAETKVFRCEVQGRVLYGDAPCANAQVLTIDAGNAAPDARQRLERDRRLLDEAASQRRAALARDDALRAAEAARRAEAERAAQADLAANAGDGYPAYGYGYAYGWGLVPPFAGARPRPHRPPPEARHERQAGRQQRFIPVPPPVHRPAR
jgi:hypothetical protein